jgi:hypothetical protein
MLYSQPLYKVNYFDIRSSIFLVRYSCNRFSVAYTIGRISNKERRISNVEVSGVVVSYCLLICLSILTAQFSGKN